MKVKFVPQNVECEIKLGQSVMHVAQDHGIYIKSVCKGVPSCAECRVRIVDGDHNVFPPGTEELSLIGTGYFIDRRRLSCQLKCFGDITVDMTEQIAKQQGLIGGQKKKKLAVKDDRIEDQHAIRGDETRPSESGGDGDEEEPPRPSRGTSRSEAHAVSNAPHSDDADDGGEAEDGEEEGVEAGGQASGPTPQGGGRGGSRRRRRRGGRGGRGGGPRGPGGGQGSSGGGGQRRG